MTLNSLRSRPAFIDDRQIRIIKRFASARAQTTPPTSGVHHHYAIRFLTPSMHKILPPAVRHYRDAKKTLYLIGVQIHRQKFAIPRKKTVIAIHRRPLVAR
jgi:hypothetical protein